MARDRVGCIGKNVPLLSLRWTTVGQEMLPQHDRHVIVLLKDGRQLDGLLARYTHHMVCAGVQCYQCEIDELIDDV
jgi:hypothetical protein